MSQNAYTSCKFVELFCPSNKTLIDKWKINSCVKKVFDSEAKTYVFTVGANSPEVQMCLPDNSTKKSLALPHPILVFQICFPPTANILIDIRVTTYTDQRKRITLSSNQKIMRIEPFSVSMPLKIEGWKNWAHIAVDLEDIVLFAWRNEKLKNIISLSLSGVFIIKRVFTVRRDMILNKEGNSGIQYDKLPKKLQLTKRISQIFRFISSRGIDIEFKRDDQKNLDGSISEGRSSTVSSASSICSNKNLSFYMKSSKSSVCSRMSSGSISSSINTVFGPKMDAKPKFLPEERATSSVRRNQSSAVKNKFPSENDSINRDELNVQLLLSKLTFVDNNVDMNSKMGGVTSYPNSDDYFDEEENLSPLTEKESLSMDALSFTTEISDRDIEVWFPSCKDEKE